MSGEPTATRGPVPWLPRALAGAGARVYGWEIARRNRAYDRGEGVTTLDVPVVSVGNLSVGGTGKTPMVEHLVRVLGGAGKLPCIAMRGYRSKDGVSDEAEEYREALRGVMPGGEVVVVAQPDRVAGIREVIESRSLEVTRPGESKQIDCVVLDDGFQHRKIARQFDVVLVDATRAFTWDSLLPKGWLREGPESLARAHAVVVTRADLVPDGGKGLMEQVLRFAPGALVGACAFDWVGVDVTRPDGVERREPVEWLRGRRVGVCCAIGNPGAFLRQVSDRVGAAPIEAMVLRDHDPYSPATVERLIAMARGARADAIVTTRKDWMKMRGKAWPCAVARPAVGVRWIGEGERIEGRVVEVCGS